MKLRHLWTSVAMSAIIFSAQNAMAQSFSEREAEARLMKLEQRVMELREKQGLSGAPDVAGISSDAGQNAATTQARIDALDEQMRRIRGDNERTQHLLERLNKKLDSMSSDIDYRLGEIERSGGEAIASDGTVALAVPPMAEDDGTVALDVPPMAKAGSNKLDDAAPNPLSAPISKKSVNQSNAPQMQIKISEPMVSAPKPVATDTNELKAVQNKTPLLNDDGGSFAVPSFTSAREHYNYAFGLMNKAQYEEAGDVFASFLERYPKDELRGNVYYWLGETYYVRENYKKSIDNFRLGFEENPKGNKAPDNLLKLAMSLERDSKISEACLVLDKLVEKYPTPEAVAQKAQEQLEKWSCQTIG